jgi:hypothetical protein
LQKQQNSLIAGLRATNEQPTTTVQDHPEDKLKDNSLDRDSEGEPKVSSYCSPLMLYGAAVDRLLSASHDHMLSVISFVSLVFDICSDGLCTGATDSKSFVVSHTRVPAEIVFVVFAAKSCESAPFRFAVS